MSNLFIINISASIMIVITFLIRKLVKHHIPHMVFILLWLAIGIRLLVPIKIDTPVSFYNWKLSIQNEASIDTVSENNEEIIQTNLNTAITKSKPHFKISWQNIRLIGSLLYITYFIVQYINTKKEVDSAVTLLGNKWITDKIKEQRLLFHVECKISEKVNSPAVWGTFKPVILFPTTFDFSDKYNVEYIILHECGHIKYLHLMLKIISMLIASLYWYNPFVWILYLYIDKDMEISSDRYVLKQMSGDQRANYALRLVEATSTKKPCPIFYYYYKKNFIKERIEAIMDFKKLTVGGIITSMLIPMGVVSVFATTDVILTDNDLQAMNVEVVQMKSDDTQVVENVSLDLDWNDIESYTSTGHERAASYYNVTDYKYVTYGKIPPKTIYVTIDKKGKTYTGSITRSKYVCDDKNDKYTGYYSGRVYKQ